MSMTSLSIAGETMVGELKEGQVLEYRVEPAQFGLQTHPTRAIQVGSVEESKEIIQAVLANQPGPARDIVVLNAGASVYVAGAAASLAEGVSKAQAVITSGAARDKLIAYQAYAKKHAI